MENRHGLVINAWVTGPNGQAREESAEYMVAALAGTNRVTVGADRGHDMAVSWADRQCANTAAHVARAPANRSSSIASAPLARRLCGKATYSQAHRGVF